MKTSDSSQKIKRPVTSEVLSFE